MKIPFKVKVGQETLCFSTCVFVSYLFVIRVNGRRLPNGVFLRF